MRVHLSWLAVLLLACPKRDADEREMRPLLDAADAVWKDRGTLGLEAASAPLVTAWARDPRHPGVSWRLARLKVAEGLVAEDDDLARASYADARALAIGCLDQDLVFAEQRASTGWEVALEGLPVARSRCAAWAALAWSRWMEVTGGIGTSLDLDAIDALVTAAVASDDPETLSIGVWAQGVLAAVRPPWEGGSTAAAREALDRAIELEPDALVRQVDLYLLVLEPAGDPEAPTLRDRIAAAPATTPEDRAAQQRIVEEEKG